MDTETIDLTNADALVVTNQLVGGLGTMTKFIIDSLREKGFKPIASYEPYSLNPSLSVPIHKLFRRNQAL